MPSDWFAWHDWLGPDGTAALQAGLLVLLALAVGLALLVLARLRAFRRATKEWAAALTAFSERAAAAEAGLARLNAVLEAEAGRRRRADAPDVATIGAPDVAPVGAPPVADPPSRPLPATLRRAPGPRSILSMQ